MQRYLAERVSREFELVALIVQVSPPPPALSTRVKRYLNPLRTVKHLVARAGVAWFQRRDRRRIQALFALDGWAGGWPSCAVACQTVNINAEEVVRHLATVRPDVVLVNGTQLLRRPVLALRPQIRPGFLNLHTGLSPYSRGGNCNLYMLLEGRLEWCGVTVHAIDEGIDSGPIFRSAQLEFDRDDSYELIDARSFRQGFDLLIDTAKTMQRGGLEPVPQWEDGKLFLRRTGYVFEPWQRLCANLQVSRGAVKRYLAAGGHAARPVRLI